MDWISLIKIFFMSAIPLTEQRAAIPIGILGYGLNPIATMIASFLGSLLPVPFVLIFFNVIYNWLKRYTVFNPLVSIIDNKIRKNSAKLKKYEEIGLIIFVGIPLPTTGLWTGSALAAVLGFDLKKAFICNAIGGAISAVIITIVSVAFPALL